MAKTENKFVSKITPFDKGGVARTVIVKLGNGVEVRGCLDDYSEEICERLMIHGLSQKLGDSASSFSKERDFHGAFSAIQAVEDGLRAGNWSQRAGSGTADVVAALAEIQNCTIEEAQAAIDQADEEQLAAIRKHPEVVKVVRRLQAERAEEAASKAQDMPDLGDLMAKIGKKG